jgi:alanine dehydrogenase
MQVDHFAEGAMLVGVPKEIKDHENRVGLVPATVRELVRHGHQVLVERDAGRGAGISNEDYTRGGAFVANDAESVWSSVDFVVKVKEPLAAERKQLRKGQVLFTYLHLAPDRDQTNDLIRSQATCIAYETVTGPRGTLPLLTPMSEVAGRMSVQVGAHFLENSQQGRGVLLGGVPGVSPAHVLVLGGGVAGTNAVLMAVGLGADVTVVDRSADALRQLAARFEARIKTAFPTEETLARLVADADLIIGAVLVPGATAPKLITRDMLRQMKPGSVLVDVSIDQGGCAETSRPTTHSSPTYIVDGVVHYCVANMPGGVARTSTFALNNVTLPFVLAIANKGWRRALRDDSHLMNGLNVHDGQITHPVVAEALGCRLFRPELALAALELKSF